MKYVVALLMAGMPASSINETYTLKRDSREHKESLMNLTEHFTKRYNAAYKAYKIGEISNSLVDWDGFDQANNETVTTPSIGNIVEVSNNLTVASVTDGQVLIAYNFSITLPAL